jgi:tetratricopeptide (TPR) repeat protein
MVRRRADLEAAFRHALGRRDADLALDLGSGLLALHYRLGTVARGVDLLDQALRLGGHPLKRLAALWWHVPMLLCELRVGAATEAFEELHHLPAQLLARGARFAAGVAVEVQGDLALARGALDEGLALLTAARDHHAACNDVCSLDAAVARLAEAARLAGREREPAAACEDALAFAPRRPIGERNTQLLHEAALAAAQAGRTERAAGRVRVAG